MDLLPTILAPHLRLGLVWMPPLAMAVLSMDGPPLTLEPRLRPGSVWMRPVRMAILAMDLLSMILAPRLRSGAVWMLWEVRLAPEEREAVVKPGCQTPATVS